MDVGLVITEYAYSNNLQRRKRQYRKSFFISCAQVLSPSYSGSLLSFFSIPFTQTPLDSLEALRKVMLEGNFSLGNTLCRRKSWTTYVDTPLPTGVTDGSSSFGIISTGGRIYADIWSIMVVCKARHLATLLLVALDHDSYDVS